MDGIGRSATRPVALVSMPTLSGRFPSFQLWLLKPFLEKQGFSAQSFSLFMCFGTHIGWRMNEVLAEVWPSLIGEWIWTKAAFDDHEEDLAYFEAFERNFRTICNLAGCTLDDLRRLRDDAAPRFIAFCVESVDWSRFGLVGFSLVFQQLLASVALARALKKKYPDLPIIFGGEALEDDIAEEIMRGCPQVDHVFCGDAEISLPKVVRGILQGDSVSGQQGLMSREGGRVVFGGRAPNLRDLNVTPVPSSRNISTPARRAATPNTIPTALSCSRSKPPADAGGAPSITARFAASIAPGWNSAPRSRERSWQCWTHCPAATPASTSTPSTTSWHPNMPSSCSDNSPTSRAISACTTRSVRTSSASNSPGCAAAA
jgi:hypothetical protein